MTGRITRDALLSWTAVDPVGTVVLFAAPTSTLGALAQGGNRRRWYAAACPARRGRGRRAWAAADGRPALPHELDRRGKEAVVGLGRSLNAMGHAAEFRTLDEKGGGP